MKTSIPSSLADLATPAKSNTDDEIWVSEAPLRAENIRRTLSNLVPREGKFDEAHHFAKKSAEENNLGISMRADRFPKHIYSDGTASRTQKFPDIFRARKFMVVSEATVRVLRAFDLGNGAVYPVRLTRFDKETPVSNDGWYCLNFGNAKDTIIPERPIGMMRVARADDLVLFLLGGYLKPKQLAVKWSSLAGADLWVDPRMLLGFFVSGRLAAAIRAAKLKGFYLSPCETL